MKDFAAVFVGIVLTFLLVKMGILQQFFDLTRNAGLFTSFVAGILLSSSLTIAIALLAIIDISKTTPPLVVALMGALGAVIGDLFLFLFVRDELGRNVGGYMKEAKYKKAIKFFHLSSMKWLAILVGIIAIALPIPDELGLALLGLAKVRTPYVLVLSFLTTFVEILIIISLTHVF